MSLENQVDEAESDARKLVAGLGEVRGTWHLTSRAWSVAECLDHIAAANGSYVRAMNAAVLRAKDTGQEGRGPSVPGFLGRWFVWSLEPPVRIKLPAPSSIRPSASSTMAGAVASLLASHKQIRDLLRSMGDVDLERTGFDNPFVKRVRFSVGTGLAAMMAHERRHLWQAWRVRKEAETRCRVT